MTMMMIILMIIMNPGRRLAAQVRHHVQYIGLPGM